MESSVKDSYESGKFVMVLIHQAWCGACKNLKPVIANSQKITDLSKDLVMVNLLGDDVPPSPKFSPDGNYFPRILFFDPASNLVPSLINPVGNEKYKYYHFNEDSILKVMESAITMQKSFVHPEPTEGTETDHHLPERDQVDDNHDEESDYDYDHDEL